MKNYARIVAAVEGTPWAIRREKAAAIQSFLSRKANGEDIPAAEIAAASASNRAKPRAQKSGVGVVPIYGTITQRADLMTEFSGGTSTDEAAAWLNQLAANPNIEAIILDVDSPGGTVYGVEELALKIQAVAKSKKVIGIANSEAASAAYWLLAQCSEVVVTPNGQVGSIGVYQIHIDRSDAIRQSGQKVSIVSAGQKKTAGNSFAPLDEVGRAEIQSGVNDYYAKFTKAVARGRNISQAAVRDTFGQGGMVRAETAVMLGMADRVGTLEGLLGRYGLAVADVRPVATGATAGATAGPSADHAIEVRRRRLLLDSATSAHSAPNYATTNPAAWNTALHEAGHAVAALALGLGFGGASIVPDRESAGRVDVAWGRDESSNAVVLWAGIEAESLGPPAQRDTWSSDRRLMLQHAHAAVAVEAGSRANALVLRNAPAIRAVAAKLMIAKKLSYAEIAAVARPFGVK